MSAPVTKIGAIEVIDWIDGSKWLRQSSDPRDLPADDLSMTVPREHRAAVALALLGGLTDELIERCAEAYFGAYWHADEWHPTPYADQSDHEQAGYRVVARAVLRAAFGVAEDGD